MRRLSCIRNDMKRVLAAAGLTWLLAFTVAGGQVKPGLEVALGDSLRVLQGKRVGLITNHTGLDRDGRRNIDLLFRASGVQLVALFGPEHGIGGVVRGGDRIASGVDTATRLPVYSLYSSTRIPTPEMLENVDVLVYDIQDVGARVYTYVWTMALSALEAERHGKSFIVLDRPNPIRADRAEGGVLETRYRSFVGQYDVALRYGLTAGELLRFLVGTGRVSANITVIPMQGYKRSMWYSETGIPWINPSPNIRDEETALLYPGTVFFEATNLSEGRGTDAPLKQVGAQWLKNAPAIARELNGQRIPGIRFEAVQMSVAKGEKWGGVSIPGIRLHVTDRDRAQPVDAAVRMMRAIYRRHPREWRWREQGIERLSGTAQLRRAVERGGVDALLAKWRRESRAFQESTRKYWLYE
jgi:uncharacterized protein YbbC (DUF1343 family)